MNTQEFIDAVMSAADEGEGPDAEVAVVDKHGDPHEVKGVYWDDELSAVGVEYK
jgi:hypothetical protein